MSEQEQFDQFEAWWKTLNIYDPTLKALCGSAWMQAIRSTSVTTAAGCDNDPWVTQDRVPARVGIDEYRYASWTEDPWRLVKQNYGFTQEHHHGWETPGGDTLLLRCRASQLPEVCAAEQQLNEDPDEWVVQDRVPVRPGTDQIYWNEKLFTPQSTFGFIETYRGSQSDGKMHGYKADGMLLSVRCRRRDLPPVEQAQLDVIGTLSFDPATGEYSRTPQPQKTRVRLWIEGPTKMVMCRDKAPYGDWQELHHDSEGFYVEQGQ